MGKRTRNVWTSGARGNKPSNFACRQYKQAGKHVISLKLAQRYLAPLKQLEEEGWAVTLLDVEKNGQFNYSNLVAALRDDTIMVSVMKVHNEIGIVQNIKQIADLCHQRGIMLHVDCAQTSGKAPHKF